jgi:hypothetical protein
MLYSAAISRNLIDIVIKETGRVFKASSPDIYSGYAFAYLSKNYISIGYPLSINGVSSKSNGAAHLNNNESLKVEFTKLLQKSEIKWPISLPFINTAYIGIIEPFIQLANYFPKLNNYQSKKERFKLIIDKLDFQSEQDMLDKKEVILNSCKDDRKLFIWVTKYLEKQTPINTIKESCSSETIEGFIFSHLYLDASKFGLKNVYDVSIFINNLFGNLKELNFEKPIEMNLISRIKRAGGLILKG